MDSATSDPFLLDWGSSLNVNEDLRRSIQHEISAVDRDLRSLDTSIRTEAKVSKQSRRDLSYAQAELIHLHRGAGDEEDNAVMNEQIQNRLSDSLEREVVAVVSPVPASREESLAAHGASTGGPGPRRASTAKLEAGMADISKRARDVRRLKTMIQTKKESLHDCRSKNAEVKYLVNNAAARITRETKNQTTWNEDVKVKRQENASEKQRLRRAKESLYRSRKNTGEYTQQRAKYLNELGSIKQMNQDGERQLSSILLRRKNADIYQLREEVKALSHDVAAKSDHLDTHRRQQSEREEIVVKHHTAQRKFDAVKEHLQCLGTESDNVIGTLDGAQRGLELDKHALNQDKKKLVDLDKLLALSEKDEAEVVAPSRTELPKLLEEAEDLARMIESCREKLSGEKRSSAMAMSSTRDVLGAIKNQVIDKRSTVSEKMHNLSLLQDTQKETEKAASKEIEQHISLKCKFEEAGRIEAGVVECLQEQLSKERSERHRRYEHESHAETVKRDVLSCGVDIMKETEHLERKYQHLAIQA